MDVLTPDDLRDRNPNAVGGDPYGGSAELDQSLLWRPLAGWIAGAGRGSSELEITNQYAVICRRIGAIGELRSG